MICTLLFFLFENKKQNKQSSNLFFKQVVP